MSKTLCKMLGYLLGNRYTVLATSAATGATYRHVSSSYADALEWAACYPCADSVRIYHSAWYLAGHELVAMRWPSPAPAPAFVV
jgi:hypothetical protein